VYEQCAPPFTDGCPQRNTAKGNLYEAARVKARADSTREDCLAAGGGPVCEAAYVDAAAESIRMGTDPALVTWGNGGVGASVPVNRDNPVLSVPGGAIGVVAPVYRAAAVPAAGVPVALPAASDAVMVGGLDLSAIPWWGWAGAAAAAYFMLGKGGR